VQIGEDLRKDGRPLREFSNNNNNNNNNCTTTTAEAV